MGTPPPASQIFPDQLKKVAEVTAEAPSLFQHSNSASSQHSPRRSRHGPALLHTSPSVRLDGCKWKTDHVDRQSLQSGGKY